MTDKPVRPVVTPAQGGRVTREQIKGGMSFPECVVYCAGIPSLVEQFDRLAGTRLSQIDKRAPIDKMVDDACGVTSEEDMKKWTLFVWECIWTRLPPDAFERAGA